MYDAERQLLNRWLKYPHACNASFHLTHSSTSCLKRADLIIAATPLHEFLQHPELWKRRKDGGPGNATYGTTYLPMINFQVFSEMPRKFDLWWARLCRQAAKWTQATFLVHYSHPFDLHVSQTFLRGLSRQPGWFQRRTIVACYESNLRDDVRARLRGLNATLISIPHTTSVWKRARHFALDTSAHRGKSRRQNFILLQGKQQRGKSTSIRMALATEIRKAGGVCTVGRCVLGGAGESRLRLEERLRARPYILWEDESESAFCLQPPGDTLTRSHFYVSVQAGCIPVVFDGVLQDYRDERSTTAWAWRDFVPFEEMSVALSWPLKSSALISHLRAIPAPRLGEMRLALDRYANLTIYGDGSFNDAFFMLLFAVRKARSREMRLREMRL